MCKCKYDGKKVIVSGEYNNAFYVNGQLVSQAEDDYLSTETLHNLWPEAEYYGAYDLEENGIIEDGYPPLLEDLPLDRCEKFWPREGRSSS